MGREKGNGISGRGKKRGYQFDDQIFISGHFLDYWALW